MAAMLLAGCGDTFTKNEPVAGERATAKAEYERGPHRGRMLRSGDLALEITIFEEGTEPEFRVYAYWQNKPIDPSQVTLSVTLARLGGRTDPFAFTPKGEFLQGNGVVREPHSFDVLVKAIHGNQEYSWSYDSYEGRTTISADQAEASGVKSEPVGPAVIDEVIDLSGRVVLQPQGRAEVRAWYPGRIMEMTKTVGQAVRQGELLVRIEASDSLRTYQINAPISGVVTERNGSVGDVATQSIYVIIDASKLQTTFFAFPRDAERLQPGQPVEIEGLGGQRASSTVSMLLPSADAATQTVSIYADLPNPQGKWRPGMAVEGVVTVASNKVPLAVRTRALQRFRDFTVVFAKVGDTYEVRMLKLGRRTSEWTEVLSGIEPGEVYVTDNAFLIRADIEKSGASHDH
jgi:cobalt-zinc-cadmium efflux system membrane fusion protein